MPVKSGGAVMLRLDDQQGPGDPAAVGSFYRVDQEQSTEPSVLHLFGNGESSEENGGDLPVAG